MELIWAAAVTGMFTVVCVLLNRTRQHSKVIREQVVNHHDTNLRVESDERHAENKQLLTQLLLTVEAQGSDLSGVKSDVRGVRRDIGRLADADVVHDKRIRQIDERTRPRAEVQREMEEYQHGKDRG